MIKKIAKLASTWLAFASLLSPECQAEQSTMDFANKTQMAEAGNANIYFKSVISRIEKTGNSFFPKDKGKKLNGELLVYVPIFQDGTIFTDGPGMKIIHGSGNKILDAAALEIVLKSLQFESLPKEIRSTDKNAVWEANLLLRFNPDEGLRVKLQDRDSSQAEEDQDLNNTTVHFDSFQNIEKAILLSKQIDQISKDIEKYNRYSTILQKKHITPSTKSLGYASYYKNVQEKIEQRGNLQFPQLNGQKLYGKLRIYIPIYQDGTIYEKEGGVRIEQSSGNSALDSAAVEIVRNSAPFSPFPKDMRSINKEDVWEIITSFNFTQQNNGASKSSEVDK